MNNTCNNPQRKTLTNCIKTLQETVSRFEQLSVFSTDLFNAFERKDNNKLDVKPFCTEDKELNIIELFDEINDKLNILHDRISENIKRTINMII